MVGELDAAIQRYHDGGVDLVKGNPERQKAVFSRRPDATLMNPTGIVARGPEQIDATVDGVASQFSEGVIEFERIAYQARDQLACIVEVERWDAQVAGVEQRSSGEIRVTSVLVPEDGTWKVWHRHADPIPVKPPPG